MPEIPYEQLMQAQLGTLVAVFGIVLLIVIGLTVTLVGVPLMRLLTRMADSTQTAQRDAQTALAGAQAAQTALASAGTALTAALAENTAEAKMQTSVLTALKQDFHSQIEISGKAITARLDAHDQQAREGIARIESTLAQMRDEFATGHKAQRGEVLGRLDEVLAEIRNLKPPPPPPKVMPIAAPEPDTLLEKTA